MAKITGRSFEPGAYPGTLRDRIQDLVAGLAILSAELHSLQRQQSALQLLLAAAQERIKGVFSNDQEAQEAHKQLRKFATTGQREIKDLLQLRKQLQGDQPLQRQDSDSQVESQTSEDDSTDSGSDEKQANSTGEDLDRSAEALVQITAGSAAVNIARAEHARAVKLEAQVKRLQAEQADLRSQILALQGRSEIPGTDDNGESQAWRKKQLDRPNHGGGERESAHVLIRMNQQLRSQVARLSSEIASLSHERDVLLGQVLAGPGAADEFPGLLHKLQMSGPPDRGRLPEISASPSRSRSTAVDPRSTSITRTAVTGNASPERSEKKPSFDPSPVDAEESMRQRRQQDVSMTLAATSRADPGHGLRRFRSIGPDGHKQEAAILRNHLVKAERSRAQAASELTVEKRKTTQQNLMIAQLDLSVQALQEQVKAKERALVQALAEAQRLHQERDAALFELATAGRT